MKAEPADRRLDDLPVHRSELGDARVKLLREVDFARGQLHWLSVSCATASYALVGHEHLMLIRFDDAIINAAKRVPFCQFRSTASSAAATWSIVVSIVVSGIASAPISQISLRQVS